MYFFKSNKRPVFLLVSATILFCLYLCEFIQESQPFLLYHMRLPYLETNTSSCPKTDYMGSIEPLCRGISANSISVATIQINQIVTRTNNNSLTTSYNF